MCSKSTLYYILLWILNTLLPVDYTITTGDDNARENGRNPKSYQ